MTFPVRARRLAATLAAVTLLATACGGGGDSGAGDSDGGAASSGPASVRGTMPRGWQALMAELERRRAVLLPLAGFAVMAATVLAGAIGGAGLGLAIVRQVAESHGGSVVAERANGGGARMSLKLPVAD